VTRVVVLVSESPQALRPATVADLVDALARLQGWDQSPRRLRLVLLDDDCATVRDLPPGVAGLVEEVARVGAWPEEEP